MGKWSEFRSVFPALPRDEAIAEAAEALLSRGSSEVVRELVARKLRLAQIEDERKGAQAELEIAEAALLRFFERSDVDRIDHAGMVLSRAEEPYPQVVDKAALLAWASEESPEIVGVQWNTLKATVKAALEDAQALPPGVDVFMKSTIRSTRKR